MVDRGSLALNFMRNLSQQERLVGIPVRFQKGSNGNIWLGFDIVGLFRGGFRASR